MNKLKKSICLSIAAIITAFSFSLIPISTTHADECKTGNICCQKGVSKEVKKANGCGEGSENELKDVIITIVNRVVGALAVVAVIFVVVGGINYMTSQGDPGKTKKAKDTILYATIGLIICVLAFAIVNFVIKKILA